MNIIEMGILAPKGYKSGSVASGIKKRKLDMTIITSDLKSCGCGSLYFKYRKGCTCSV